MGQSGHRIRDILIWNHERGTLPYDILCGLILAFVFFVPRSCFAPKNSAAQADAPTSQGTSTSNTRNPNAPMYTPQQP